MLLGTADRYQMAALCAERPIRLERPRFSTYATPRGWQRKHEHDITSSAANPSELICLQMLDLVVLGQIATVIVSTRCVNTILVTQAGLVSQFIQSSTRKLATIAATVHNLCPSDLLPPSTDKCYLISSRLQRRAQHSQAGTSNDGLVIEPTRAGPDDFSNTHEVCINFDTETEKIVMRVIADPGSRSHQLDCHEIQVADIRPCVAAFNWQNSLDDQRSS